MTEWATTRDVAATKNVHMICKDLRSGVGCLQSPGRDELKAGQRSHGVHGRDLRCQLSALHTALSLYYFVLLCCGGSLGSPLGFLCFSVQ